MSLRTAIPAALLLAVTTPALAGPIDEARAHFDAIAAGNVEKIMQQYTDDAVFQWVGGPLDGAYTGTDGIRTVWTKFTRANAPLDVKVSKLIEAANPKGATVTANVVFKGKQTIKVRYVLVYRGGKLVDEVWQIAPHLGGSY
ncbi:MAG: nuclear transport factor 2 family protein [Gammaproteobacteria bacterium]|nr:nuclear transport factor 2 family protein [Gammaproteobacteria bacterium]